MSNKPELPWIPPSRTAPDGPAAWVKGFRVGNVEVKRPFILAPMSGVTDTAFRRTVQIAGRETTGLLVTEFICIEGLTNANLKARTRLAFDAQLERPLAVQIFGYEIARMAEAARICEAAGADIVDINCGCPAPKIVRKGGGAELMRQPDHLARMVESTVAAVDIPVTVKIRTGWDDACINALEVSRQCERAGAQMIAIHGRTRKQLYGGQPDWDLIAEVADHVDVPVVGSGDIADAAGALYRLRESGCAGVMIGRAAVMNPWIFGQVDDLVQGRVARVADDAERLRVLAGFRDMMRAYIPERAIPGRLKQLLARLTKGFDHGGLLRHRVLRAKTTEEMFEWIESFFAATDEGRIDQWAVKEKDLPPPSPRVPRGVRRRRAA